MTAMALGRRCILFYFLFFIFYYDFIFSNQFIFKKIVFRAGKPIEDINAFLKALAIQDPFIRLLTCARHLLLAGWLSVDTVQWVFYWLIYLKRKKNENMLLTPNKNSSFKL